MEWERDLARGEERGGTAAVEPVGQNGLEKGGVRGESQPCRFVREVEALNRQSAMTGEKLAGGAVVIDFQRGGFARIRPRKCCARIEIARFR